MTRWGSVALYVGLTLSLGLGTQALVDRGYVDPFFEVLAPYSPALVALVMRKVISREGYGDAQLRLRGVAARYWLLACGLPLLWNAIPAAVELVQGVCTLDTGGALRGLPRWLYATGPRGGLPRG